MEDKRFRKITKLSSSATLIGLALILVVAAGLYLLLRNRNENPIVTDFAGCQRAGNPVQESYPEVCVTPEGRRFINPSQRLNQLQICPEKWYDNQQPGPEASGRTSNSQYFIVDGQRRELSEFDVEWIKQNCAVNQPQVVE